MDKGGFVYIVASRPRGTLYIGVTNDLVKRAWDHREGTIDGFTKRYGCRLLVWFEQFGEIELAIRREKQMKEWRRSWKIELIEATNREWSDLLPSLM